MAITALFYTFSKKPNSTAQPATGVTVSIELKQMTDIMNPEILVYGIPNPYVWNYCLIQSFNRYYFVRNWRWENGIWRAMLHVDTLATYKANIAASSQYVLRSASASDGRIVDTLYPMIEAVDSWQYQVTTNRPLVANLNGGYYVVGIIAKDGTMGAVNYYIMSPAAFGTLKNALFNDISWTGVTDISQDLLKTLFNPYDYIVSCKWFPVTTLPTLDMTIAVTSVNIGWWTLSVNAYRLANNANTFLAWGFEIPAASFGAHPQSSRGTYLNHGRYAEYNMLLAPYGVIPVPDTVAFAGATAVEGIDLITGECNLKLFLAAGGDATVNPLLTLDSQMAVDVQLAQVRPESDSHSRLVNIGSSFALAAENLLPNGVIKSALSGITGAVKAQTEHLTTGGSNGSFMRLGQFANFDAVCCARYQYIANEDNAHLGRPLCATRTISTLSGYILCADAEIATPGTKDENDEIMSYLNSGFYYE